VLNGVIVLRKYHIIKKPCSSQEEKHLEFPEFVVNTVVPERHSRKRWGTPEAEHEESPPRGGQSGEGAPGGLPQEHLSEGTMVFTCKKHKSLQSQYVAEILRGKLRKLREFFFVVKQEG